MSEFLDNLMLHESDTVNQNLYRLPQVLDMTSENPIINFDAGKKESYLFYVENPIQEQIGYREDLKVFVIKANPYIVKYNRSVGEYYDNFNIVDGDTMYFDIDSIVDNDTEFTVANKKYSSFKAFLEANNQRSLIVRLLGSDCPEVIHYKEVPLNTEKLDDSIVSKAYKVAKNDLNRYTLEHLNRSDEDVIKFFKTPDGYYEIIGTPYHKDNDTSISYLKIVSRNETILEKQGYIDEGIACKKMLIDLLTKASDIRLVLDHQSLNRKPSSYSSPYDKMEHLTDEGVLTKTFAYIEALWTEYFGNMHYTYMGYNTPGQDAYGRSLGEVYVKIYVDELKTETWVNAAKYILYHNDKFTKAAPAYTSNPTEAFHNNFMSPAFKLNTYDKRYKDIIDGFNHATSELIDERNQWYAQITGLDIDYIKEYSVILGDCVLTVPPMNIRSVTETNHTKIPLLRSKGGTVKSLPRSQKIIEMDIYFNNEYGINGAPREFSGKNGEVVTYYMNGLRSLIAMFKLTPFLPIENNYINDALLVEAVTLVNINVTTVPNYPRCLKATLTLAEFNYSIFMPELPESATHNTFSQSIHYPAMRWYYQRLLHSGEAVKDLAFNSEEYITKSYGSRTALVPMSFKDSRMNFYIPDRSQLQTRLEIMMDPKPIMTQEQLTEEMLVGAKRLKPLISNIQNLSNNGAFINALTDCFTMSYIKPYQYIYSSTALDKEAQDLYNSVPVFPIIASSTNRFLLKSGATSDVIQKTPIRYLSQVGFPYVPSFIDPIDRSSIHAILQSEFDAIAKSFQAQLGLFGIINAYARTEGSKIYIGAIVPLPTELTQSSYEVRVIAQKICTTFGIDQKEADNLFAYTSEGILGIPIEVTLDIEPYCYTEDKKITYYKLAAHNFEGTLPRLQLNVNGLGIRTLNYLYSVASDEKDSGIGDNIEKDLIEEKKDIALNSAMGLKFLKYDAGDMLVEQIAINYSNTFSNMSLNMIDGKAFQYCGAQDIQLQIAIVTKSNFTVDALTHLPELSAEYARTYRKVLNCWPLRLDCELSKMFGILEVLIDNVQTETIPNQPGLTRVTLSLSSVDRTVRQKEALSKIDTESNAGYINYGNRGQAEVKTYFDLKHSLAKAELYPDLELPTVDELHEAGFELYRNKSVDINKPNRSYVDPDFYFIYGQALACEIFRDNFLKSFEQELQEYDLTDTQGAYTRYVLKKVQSEDTQTTEEVLEFKNDIAVSQNSFYTNIKEIEAKYDYKDMSNEVLRALDNKGKNTFKLGQTLAELGTMFWNITDEIKLPFTESVCDLMPSNVTQAYKDKKQSIIDAIDNFLSVPIEDNIPKLYDNTIEPGVNHKKQTSQFEKICKEIASVLCEDKNISELMLIADKEENLRINANLGLMDALQESFAGILMAYADAHCGESYYTNQNLTIDEDKKSNKKYSWKAKMYMNTDKINPVPYAKVNRNNAIYAESISDAITNGTNFGPFNIGIYNGEMISTIYSDKTLVKNKKYFLDPYYLDLQTKQSSKIKEHKEKLLTLTGYSAVAFVREILVLYRHYVVTGKLFSLYEIARMDAVDAWRDNWRSGASPNMNVNMYDKQNIEESKKDAIAKQTEIVNDYVEVLKSLSKTKLDNEEERRLIVQELRIPEDSIIGTAIIDINGKWSDILFSPLYSDDHIHNHAAKSIKLLQDKYKDLYDKSKDNQEVEPEVVARYKKLYEICLNYESVNVIEFAQDLQEMMLMFESDNRFSMSYAEQTMTQVLQDERKMFPGRFLGMACALIEPQTICPLIEKKNADALNILISNASRPDTSQANSKLRKFLYALDGRKVLSLSNIGDIPVTLEAEYRNYITERVLIERSKDPRQYLRDSFYDMIKNDKRGRMLRAYPTYYMFFIDEGREIGLWKLHDNFYSSTAIAEIEITKSRKIAADTAHIVLSNLFNSYTQDDKDFVYDLDNVTNNKSIKYKVHDAFNALFSPRTYFDQEEKKRLNTPTPLTARLTPGTRMHIRMGYGANAAELPIVFNGQIAEIGNGEVCEIVAQGDGVELLNPIQDIQDSSDIQFQDDFTVKRFFEKWLTNGASPKTIIGSILTSRGYWKDKVVEDISNGYLRSRNPYGIAHFGDVFFDKIFKGSECIQNLFEANSGSFYDLPKDEEKDYIGLEKNYKVSGVPIIAIDVLGKTLWDIMHICASVVPDFKTAVVPFELRSSVFMGSGRDYYAFEYGLQQGIEENSSIIVEHRKPFEQYHYYTSYSDIIQNNIVANSMNVKTNAVGLYQQTGSWGKVKPKETERLYVDYDIYPEYQKSTTIDTQLWAQGMPILGNGFFLGMNADIDDDVDDLIPGAKEIAWRMTASGLKNAMKDMYEGELIVIGDPSVKPHDRMLLTDLYEEMQGAAWVEAVVHSFNAQTGFTTSVYADCINEIDDRYERQNEVFTKNACATALAAYATPVAMNQLLFRKNMKHINNGIMNLILKGGLNLERDKTPIVSLFNMVKMDLSVDDIKVLETAIKTANIFEPTHFGGIVPAFKQKQSIRQKVMQATQSVFASNGEVFVKALLGPFDDVTKKLVSLSDMKTARDVAKILHQNAKALEEVSGETVINALNSISSDKVNANDLQQTINGLKNYDVQLSSDITDTFKLNQAFRDSIDDLGNYILNSDIEGEVRDLAAILRDYKDGTRVIDSPKEMKLLADSLDECAKVCKDTKMLKNIANSMDEIKDFSKIADTAKDVSKYASKIDDIVKGIGALSGPFGIATSVLLMAAEMAISFTIGAYASEAVERYLQNLQVMRIYPLSKNGKVMVAGITGHKGLVVGSPTENMQGGWTEFVTGLFGAKEPTGLVTGAIQYFFASDKAKQIARRYRTDNNVPDTLDSSYSLAELQAKFDNNFNQRLGVLSSTNELLNLNLNRYEDLKESSAYFKEYLAKSYRDGKGLDKKTQQEFILIKKHASVARYMDLGILQLYHDLNSDAEFMAMLGDESVDMNIFYEDDNKINVPILRRDTLTVLNMLISKYVENEELNIAALDLEERIQNNQLQITSATIIDSDGYDGTGFVFRITSQNLKALETACYDLVREINAVKHTINHFEMGSDHIIALAIPIVNKEAE